MLRAELYECKHDINDMPEQFWHDGMVFESENLDAQLIYTFDSINDALAELDKHECSAIYLGGISRITRAIEYWVEVNEYDDEDGEYVGTMQCYYGKYPVVERRNALKARMKDIIDDIHKLKIDGEVIQANLERLAQDAQDDMSSANIDLMSTIAENLEEAIERINYVKGNLYYVYFK